MMPTLNEFLGTFKILGSNQDAAASNYQGILKLSSDDNEIVRAQWMIGTSQKHKGIGFLEEDRLLIKFQYAGYDDRMYHGVVEYHLLEKGILAGFWTEDYGDNHFVGTEQCFKLTSNTES